MKRVLYIALVGCLLSVASFAQAQKFALGLPVWDVAFGNAAVEGAYQFKPNWGLELQAGYSLNRKYTYQSQLTARNKGPFAGIGFRTSTQSPAENGKWMLHLRMLYIFSQQSVQADIQNYYGNVHIRMDWQQQFWIGQLELGHAWTWGHFNLEPSLRLSLGPVGEPKHFHAYLPMVGRLHTFAGHYKEQVSFSALPGLHLAYWF